jgi:hypothetical protein
MRTHVKTSSIYVLSIMVNNCGEEVPAGRSWILGTRPQHQSYVLVAHSSSTLLCIINRIEIIGSARIEIGSADFAMRSDEQVHAFLESTLIIYIITESIFEALGFPL